MEEEKMLVPSGLKTVDGKDIMCYTGAFYLKNEEKIKRIIKTFYFFFIIIMNFLILYQNFISLSNKKELLI